MRAAGASGGADLSVPGAPGTPVRPEARTIAVFAAHTLPHVGGVELYLDGLLRRLSARGWTITLVASDVGGGAPEEQRDGIRVLRLPSAPWMSGRLPVPFPGRTLLRALRAVRAASPAAIVTNTRFQPITWLGAWLSGRARIPLLHIEHGSGHVPMKSRAADWISRALDRTAGRWVIRRGVRHVGVSDACAAFLRTLGAPAPGVLHSGVDRVQRPSPEGLRWRARLGIAEDDVAITYVGRVTDDKGIPILLEAFRSVCASAPVHLVVAGDGHALDGLRAAAADLPRVHLLGRIPPPDVAGLLAASDVFAHPSRCSEGLPRAVLEAAAAGLPIVATPQGGTREVIRSAEEGLLVPPGDVTALAGALERLACEPALRQALGDAARRSVQERFDWTRIIAQAEAFIGSIRVP
jgi:glycosyltransferase involved in cell wall biosynthesis